MTPNTYGNTYATSNPSRRINDYLGTVLYVCDVAVSRGGGGERAEQNCSSLKQEACGQEKKKKKKRSDADRYLHVCMYTYMYLHMLGTSLVG